jgi:hypothetical protein
LSIISLSAIKKFDKIKELNSSSYDKVTLNDKYIMQAGEDGKIKVN